jgi:hypothetical protein
MQSDNTIALWTEPLGVIAKIFIIYLILVACILVIRNIHIACQLWSFSRKREPMGSNIIEKNEFIIKMALKGRLEATSKLPEGADGNIFLIGIERIEIKYLYLWNKIYRIVQATKSLATITIFITVCMAWLGLIIISNDSAHKPDIAFAISYFRDLLWLLYPGLWLSALLYGSAFWFQGSLTRRMTEWNYAKASFITEIRSITNR